VVGTNLKLSAVPVVMVFTKFDLFVKQNRKRVKAEHPNEDPGHLNTLVEKAIGRRLQDAYLQPLRNCTGKAEFPHAIVSGKNPPEILIPDTEFNLAVTAPDGASVQGLVKTTQQLLSQKFGPLASKSPALWASVAQRVSPDDKIESSIEYVQQLLLHDEAHVSSIQNCTERLASNPLVWGPVLTPHYVTFP